MPWKPVIASVGTLIRPQVMTAIALRTELDVAELLLARGWLPEEINSVLVFPLPGAAFCSLLPESQFSRKDDVIKATAITPEVLHRARQLLLAAGWPKQELNSLLKPGFCSIDPGLNPVVPEQADQESPQPSSCHWLKTSTPTVSLQQYRRTMAAKRVGSLGLVIMGVCLAVMLTG